MHWVRLSCTHAAISAGVRLDGSFCFSRSRTPAVVLTDIAWH
jgi:hypothetical protein